MKAVFLSLLFLLVVVCKAAKFPFHLRNEQSKGDEVETRSVIQEPVIVPVNVGNKAEQDCSFCEYFLNAEECFCEDVNWCREKQCNVPERCDEHCVAVETPKLIQEPEIVPVTAATVGNNSEQDCSFCEYFLKEECVCEDVNSCREERCNVPERCDERCPLE